MNEVHKRTEKVHGAINANNILVTEVGGIKLSPGSLDSVKHQMTVINDISNR